MFVLFKMPINNYTMFWTQYTSETWFWLFCLVQFQSYAPSLISKWQLCGFHALMSVSPVQRYLKCLHNTQVKFEIGLFSFYHFRVMPLNWKMKNLCFPCSNALIFLHNSFDHNTQVNFVFCYYVLFGSRVMHLN